MTQESEPQESPQPVQEVEEPKPKPKKEPARIQSSGGGFSPTIMQFVVGIAAAVVVVAIAAGINHAWPIFGSSGGGNTQVSVNALPTAAADPTPEYLTMQAFEDAKPLSIDTGNAPSKGPSSAKVTIVEFSDFECPYCDRFVTQTLPSLLKDYGDKVQFVFRDYPLPASMHPYAEKAAEAGQCANDQGVFWQFHDLMFQNQTTLSGMVQADATNGVNQVVAQMKTYAAGLNIDANAFNSCLDSAADKSKVDTDQKAMETALSAGGVSSYGTPSFFINGKFVSGAYPYDTSTSGYVDGMFTFKDAIDYLLSQ